jgi:hypothetical protein
MKWDYVSELHSPTGLLFTLQIYENRESWWNDIDRENRRTRRKSCPSVTSSTTNPTWIDPVANPGLRGERPATNRLSRGTALPSGSEHLWTRRNNREECSMQSGGRRGWTWIVPEKGDGVAAKGSSAPANPLGTTQLARWDACCLSVLFTEGPPPPQASLL